MIENIKSVRELNYIKDEFRVYPFDPIEEITHETALFEIQSTSPPIGIVFGYSSKTIFNTTFINWFRHDNSDESHLFPSHVCCLDQGIVVINNSGCLNYRDLSSFLYPYNEKEDLIIFIAKEHIVEINGKKWCNFNDKRFPYVQVGNKMMIIDQSKILLNFILYLSQMLEKKKISPRLNLRESYLPQELTNVLINHEEKIKWRKEDYPQYNI